MVLVAAFPARAQVPDPPKTPVAEGTGGSAATVDPLATQAAIDTLRSGGNAVDAAVAAAGVLGVVEPFSCGIGGGGFMVVYDARHHKVDTIDSRETAPAGMTRDAFADARRARPSPSTEARVGGLSVGVPGTVRGWQTALNRYGTRSLTSLLKPGERIAREGFTIDADLQPAGHRQRRPLRRLPRLGGAVPDARRDRQAGRLGPDATRTSRAPTSGSAATPTASTAARIARDISQTVQHPPLRAGLATARARPPGLDDPARPRALRRQAARADPDQLPRPRRLRHGPAVVRRLDRRRGAQHPRGLPARRGRAIDKLHHYLEASKLAYADRGEFLGDPDFVDVPLRGLLSDPFAAERRSLIGDTALPAPQPPGDPWPYNGGGDDGHGHGASSDAEGPSTTHLTVADRWGNVVTYTFTIEQTGGSGIVVPGRGFLLNNELTDFNFATGTANSPAPGKRPRSSMAPTIVFDHGRARGRARLAGRRDDHHDRAADPGQPASTSAMSLPDALAAPRASQRNSATTDAEPAFLDRRTAPALEARGHEFTS